MLCSSFIFTRLISSRCLLLWWPYKPWVYSCRPNKFIFNRLCKCAQLTRTVGWLVILHPETWALPVFLVSSSCPSSIIDTVWLWSCVQWEKCIPHMLGWYFYNSEKSRDFLQLHSACSWTAAQASVAGSHQQSVTHSSSVFIHSMRKHPVCFGWTSDDCTFGCYIFRFLHECIIRWILKWCRIENEAVSWPGSNRCLVPLRVSLSNCVINSSCIKPLKPLEKACV